MGSAASRRPRPLPSTMGSKTSILCAAIVLGFVFSPQALATPRLYGSVSQGSISLKNASGREVKSLPAGAYVIVVRDRTARQNFHLVGGGVRNLRTGRAYVGRAVWTVNFKRGRYTYLSDALPSLLQKTFRVT
jgi:hypothetical protein